MSATAAAAAAAAAASDRLAPPAYTYRPDIDGLRAIAVLGVIFFHLKILGATGGFVGVDIFFVISGYLVGSHVLREFDRGGFSLIRFYERRVRRIFPALIVLLICVVGCSLLVDFPGDAIRVAQTSLAALFFSSNVFFWLHTGYFEPAVNAMPLLHTWSLGVEEQFYIVFPLLIWATRATVGARAIRPVLLAIFAASFLISAVGALKGGAGAFYLLHSRAWELLAGTILGEGGVPLPSTPRARNTCSGIGLALVLAPVWLYAQGLPFPGLAAALPCGGAVLIIAAGISGGSVVGRMLSTPPAVFVGLISYSLYLWHWPLLVFARRLDLAYLLHAQWAATLVVFGVGILAAIASWRLVERPFRDRRRVGVRAVWSAAAGGSMVLASAAVAVLATHGLPRRFPAEVRQLVSYLGFKRREYKAFREGSCFITVSRRGETFHDDPCLRVRPRAPANLLMGDSQAADLWPGLSADLTGVSLMQATATGCKPTVVRHAGDAPYCAKLMRRMFDTVLSGPSPPALLLSARWTERDVADVLVTAAWAKAHAVSLTVIGPAPEYDQPLPQILGAQALHRPGWANADYVSRHRLPDQARVDAALRSALAPLHVRYVSLFDALCPGGACVTLAEPGVPMQFDDHHWTVEGSKRVGELIAPQLAR